MSLFGYPAKVVHWHSEVDDWGRPLSPTPTEKSAKVVEEQRLIRNGRGEEVQIAYTIYLEGVNTVGFDDYIEYVNAVGVKIRCDIAHIEVRKYLGTDDVKEVVVYGRPQNI
ncbi:hypothetical protein RW092_18035 [Paenibacillus sp. 3LSP]|jgi:hypothetical protein|uniref:hypothetical protein n=1 Tax=Paenibacillus sp. 3LSP TaxID=2800795 RepID=UPI0028FD87BF|nr:hypothetical protein [Paenibacillus sp. 3LSP]MDU0332079.1 hypothetical protein [Paenibacillus sp. 3LSP]